MYDKNRVNRIKEMYQPGTRIMLDSMGNDPCPIEPGSCGTVIGVDDMGSIMMKWDNGRGLSLIPDEDSFHIIQQEEISEQKETESLELSM